MDVKNMWEFMYIAYMHGSKHVCCAWVPLAAKGEVRVPGLVEYAEGTTSNLTLELFVFSALNKGFLLPSHLNPLEVISTLQTQYRTHCMCVLACHLTMSYSGLLS